MVAKKNDHVYCTFCNKECDKKIDQHSKTKRRTDVYWHARCYDDYKVLLSDSISDWIGGRKNV